MELELKFQTSTLASDI